MTRGAWRSRELDPSLLDLPSPTRAICQWQSLLITSALPQFPCLEPLDPACLAEVLLPSGGARPLALGCQVGPALGGWITWHRTTCHALRLTPVASTAVPGPRFNLLYCDCKCTVT